MAVKPPESGHKLKLGEVVGWLVEDGMITREEAADLSGGEGLRRERHPLIIIGDRQFRNHKPPHKILTADLLTEWLATRVRMPYQRVDPLKIDVPSVTRIMSNAYAGRLKILPLKVTLREAVIGTAEPFLTDWVDELSHTLRLDVQRVLVNPEDIGRYLVEFYNLAKSVQKATDTFGREVSGTITNFEQLVQLGRSGKLDANDQHVVHIVDWLLQYAFEQRASDIHIEPRREVGFFRFRIDGVLHQVYQIPMAVTNAMVSRLKILGRMDVVERRRPQDGRVKTVTPEGDEIELRLSTMPTTFGEKMVLRIFSPDVAVRGFGDLGFEPHEEKVWNDMIGRNNGIILVTGPTGSGKTTTLYSTLRLLAKPEVNVCTIEDPIEMVEPTFNQMQVQHGIGLDFAAGVRTLLRQDPDIIMVGEIRDLETAEMAVQAALTGHLVLSTLHTNDAPSAITRLLELGVPPYLVNATIIGVLAQRLVRVLCPHCRKAVAMDEKEWQSVLVNWREPVPASVNAPVGCLECRMTGYHGRIGIYEMLRMTDAVRAQVRPDVDLAKLRITAFREGTRPLRISGAHKIARGLTTAEEVLKVSPPPLG